MHDDTAKRKVLVITEAHDHTAYVVSFGLSLYSADVEIFMPSLIPYYESHSVDIGAEWSLRSEGRQIIGSKKQYDTVWMRRTAGDTLSFFEIHTDDEPYIQQLHKIHRRSLLSMISTLSRLNGGLIVNDYAAKMTANSKHLQLILAHRLGLTIPETLITNDPAEVERFQSVSPSKLLCKSFLPHTWKGAGSSWHAYASIYPEHHLVPDESVRLQPSIFQNYIEKEFELRVVIFGGEQFGIAIYSQDNAIAKIDWRTSGLYGVKCEPYKLPKDEFQKCLALMDSLGIEYGAFDFIVRPDGQIVFLEVNESGQFLFMESKCPELKLLDAACYFFLHHNLADWDPRKAQVSFPEVLECPGYQMFIERFKFFPSPDLGFVTEVKEPVPSIEHLS